MLITKTMISITKLKKLFRSKKYSKAIKLFREYFVNEDVDNLINEYIYLKRIADIPFDGKDLYLLMKSSKKNELIMSNIDEYCFCIDEVQKNLEELDIDSPLDFIKNKTPTMNELVNKRIEDFNNSVCLDTNYKNFFYPYNDFFKKNYRYENVYDSFNDKSDKCIEGKIVDKYPDQIQYCRDIFPLEPQYFYRVWINCPEEKYMQLVKNDIKIKNIIVNISSLWKWDWFKKKVHKPDFKDLNDYKCIKDYLRGGINTKNIEIEYTGRKHLIQNILLHEVNIRVIYHKCFRGGFYEYSENPLAVLLKTIYREAENKLRLNHGLPKIGEGWLSEMRLFNLIKKYFPNTGHQISPEWLKPQHIDIFVYNKKIAFEYQGRQHFEPVEFFGGCKSFKKQKKLDKKKLKKCKRKKIKLIYWRYDETICDKVLIRKLNDHNIKLPSSLKKLKKFP